MIRYTGIIQIRYANREKMTIIINQAFAAYTKDELLGMLEETRIACASLNSVEEVSAHPFLQRSDRSHGRYRHRLLLICLFAAKLGLLNVPLLGEHSQTVRQEFS